MRPKPGGIRNSTQIQSKRVTLPKYARARLGLTMTSTTLNIAVAGLRAAETRVHVRAQNVVNWLSEDYVRQIPVQTSEVGGPVIRVQRPSELSGDFPYVDLATELVDMQLAKHAYQASAKVIRTTDEMTRSLLDMIA